MSSVTSLDVDIAIIGSGPAGHRAAIEATALGARVAIIEEAAGLGGACVHYGTIPSKTLRETAYHLSMFRLRSGNVVDVQLDEDAQVASLMSRLQQVIDGHVALVQDELDAAGVTRVHGRARFVGSHLLEARSPAGVITRVSATFILIATGSSPRTPNEIAVDHEHILDSDSILSMIYLPRSLTIFGGGVIACEYASIFAVLGVRVTMLDRGTRPLAFMDAELSACFIAELEANGGSYRGGVQVTSATAKNDEVEVRLATGEVLTSHKALCALGRIANLQRLELATVGIAANARGLLEVDGSGRTAVPHIYAVGDVIGPPALASAAIEQGRRAVRSALGHPLGRFAETLATGIYTIPELSSVGMSEDEARQRHGAILVGRASFRRVARGLINGGRGGLCKLVCDRSGRLLGAHLAGEGSTELVHIAQVTLASNGTIDVFLDNIFNFPTLAEVFRVAAGEIAVQRAQLLAA